MATEKKPPQTTTQPQNQVRVFEEWGTLCVMLILLRNCRLGQRQAALIELGMIQSSDDLPAFAQGLCVVCPVSIIRLLNPRSQRQEDSGGARRVIGEARRAWNQIQIRDAPPNYL